MLSLIVREVRDNHVYFAACCILSAIMVVAMSLMAVYGFVPQGTAAIYLCGGLLFTVFGALGVAQMYGDRANRVSTLLSTQAVTRSRILVARILAGVAILVISLVPVFMASLFLLKSQFPPLQFYAGVVWDISIVLVLMGLACHAVGLLTGWTSSKGRLIASFPCLLLLLASLVVIKGFDSSAMLLLTLFIAAVWARIWHTFTSASL